MERELLNKEQINVLNQSVPGWELKGNKIERVFLFKNFVQAFGFITKVAITSEALGHHPEWSNVYSKVIIKLTTHDLGGLSSFDIQLAQLINQIAEG